ncbi:HD domain-containing protein [Pseudodesulfovibrio senegalensis]|jgi:putative hydrolase of HD superfamily|uniref:HD domain-containing protein n=1 Tax=Pseudodesulfovibrio senegalensis TaxID=1721087 RepID=A0A6N6N4F8_9BACT|nr:HD domain-containing protein [Pseudodesulfovibrio senegalensis]KAB1442833.1 HD domain-containing protein [Pseudodesulfovibrio senegalensis]
MDERFARQIEFSNTLDSLKTILRRNLIMDGSRRENSAEHSWHMSVMAMFLMEYAPDGVDQLHVMKMMLIHDVVEIDADDTFCYDTKGYEDKAEREQAAADRIFGLLPEDQQREMRALWDEFEACETLDSRFANSLDRFQVLFQNMQTQGGTWRIYDIPKSKVLGRMGQIQDGAPRLWPVVLEMLDEAVEQGFLVADC